MYYLFIIFLISLNNITHMLVYIYIFIIIYTTAYYNVTTENIRLSWDISGPVKNDSWIIEHFRINVFFKKFKMYTDNFFEGNREISK